MFTLFRNAAGARKTTVAGIALAWVLNQKAVTSVVMGAKRPDQLQDNLAASGIILTSDELSRPKGWDINELNLVVNSVTLKVYVLQYI
ncbi:aldo/keto reductase [Paenibacillus chibensis]|uniref:Aldo/keto reductase n=1 Tax=Paenibacillus chibensis TaxID=59846 RepID=A0ABU6PW02_9BACL|nr:aldo/keto reductase [Paenibacillus chibensis]